MGAGTLKLPASTCPISQARPRLTDPSNSGPASTKTSTARAVSSTLEGTPALLEFITAQETSYSMYR